MPMAPDDQAARRRPRRAWGLPSLSLALGVVFGTASWVGGRPALGLAMFAIMVAYGSVFVLGWRSESIRMMAGRGADERWQSINLRASAVAGLAVVVAVIAAFVWEIAHGRSGQVFANLGAIAGVCYLGAVLWLRWRS